MRQARNLHLSHTWSSFPKFSLLRERISSQHIYCPIVLFKIPKPEYSIWSFSIMEMNAVQVSGGFAKQAMASCMVWNIKKSWSAWRGLSLFRCVIFSRRPLNHNQSSKSNRLHALRVVHQSAPHFKGFKSFRVSLLCVYATRVFRVGLWFAGWGRQFCIPSFVVTSSW